MNKCSTPFQKPYIYDKDFSNYGQFYNCDILDIWNRLIILVELKMVVGVGWAWEAWQHALWQAKQVPINLCNNTLQLDGVE